MRVPSRAFWGVLFAFLTVAVLSPVLAQEESEASRLAKAAEQLMQQQKFEEALAEVAKAIEADENFAGAYWVQGFAYGNLNRHGDARESFLKAAELNPGWA